MATYTVTTSFSANTTAIASEVNQNFTDVLTALNSFDATNLTGTIALARISNLTSSQMSAAFFKDEDDMASDSATAVSSQQALKAYVGTQIAASIASDVTLSAYTNQDSESNAMLKSHAYLAATGGFVAVYVSNQNGKILRGYVGSTTNPAGAGTLIQRVEDGEGAQSACFSLPVAEGEYFEITYDGSNTPTILWKSMGTLSKPIDQD